MQDKYLPGQIIIFASGKGLVWSPERGLFGVSYLDIEVDIVIDITGVNSKLTLRVFYS